MTAMEAHLRTVQKKCYFHTSEEVLGRQRNRIRPWITNKVLDLCDRRRQLKQRKYTSTEAGVGYSLEYRNVNREVRKKMKAAKEEWIEEQCKNIEKGMMSGNSILKALNNTQHLKSAVIEDSSSN